MTPLWDNLMKIKKKNEHLKQYLTYNKPELKDCNKNNSKTYSVVIRKPAFI